MDKGWMRKVDPGDYYVPACPYLFQLFVSIIWFFFLSLKNLSQAQISQECQGKSC